MATIKYNYKVDGVFDSINYYRSLTPLNPEALPTPTTTGIAERTYTDTAAEYYQNYHVIFGSVKGGFEKLSDAIQVNTAIPYQYIQIPYHANPGYDNLVPPSTGWATTTILPFSDTNGWLRPPQTSIFWVKKTFIVTDDQPIYFKISVDNGCVVIVNGAVVASSNRDNTDEYGNNVDRPCFWSVTVAGTYEVFIKSFTESTAGQQGGNSLNIEVANEPFDWVPTLINSQIYLNANDLGAVDSSVATWTDRENGFNFTPYTGPTAPIVQMIGGHKAVLFRGVDQLYCTNSTALSLTQNKAFLWSFAVVRKTAIVGNVTKGIIGFSVSVGARFGLYTSLAISGANDKFSVLSRRLDNATYSTAQPSSTADIANTRLICGASNFAVPDLKLYVDGALESSVTPTYMAGNTANTPSTELQIGASSGAGGQFYLYALFFGNTPLSDTDRQKLEGWAAWNYNLVDKLPADHPYKTHRPKVD